MYGLKYNLCHMGVMQMMVNCVGMWRRMSQGLIDWLKNCPGNALVIVSLIVITRVNERKKILVTWIRYW